MEKRGWYAEQDEENPDLWLAYYETGEGWSPALRAWFHSEEDCVRFINDHLVGAPAYEDA